MRAERGKRKKFFAFADDKESLVPEACVDAVAGVTARKTGVHYPFCRGSLGNRLAARERGGGQNQELSSSNTWFHPDLFRTHGRPSIPEYPLRLKRFREIGDGRPPAGVGRRVSNARRLRRYLSKKTAGHTP
jgi:hypothetical protein